MLPSCEWRGTLRIKSTLVRVMAWCYQVTSHHLKQGYIYISSHGHNELMIYYGKIYSGSVISYHIVHVLNHGWPSTQPGSCTQPCNVNTHSRAHCSPGARLCEQWGHGSVNNGARLCASARLRRGSPVWMVLRKQNIYLYFPSPVKSVLTLCYSGEKNGSRLWKNNYVQYLIYHVSIYVGVDPVSVHSRHLAITPSNKSRKTPIACPWGRGIRVCFVSSKCDRSFTFEVIIIWAITCYNVPRYIESMLWWVTT